MAGRRPRFRDPGATPDDGFEYGVGGVTVRDATRAGICAKAVALHRELGVPYAGDVFAEVMAYMCPRLADGFCDVPSGVRPIAREDVVAATLPLLAAPSATSDRVARRLEVCAACPRNRRAGVAGGVAALSRWLEGAYGPRRGRFPADAVAGVCEVTLAMVSAQATADGAGVPGAPDNCWARPGAGGCYG